MTPTKHREVAQLEGRHCRVRCGPHRHDGLASDPHHGTRPDQAGDDQRICAAQGHQRNSADVRRPVNHLRQVRPDHRLEPGRIRRIRCPGSSAACSIPVPPADADEVQRLFKEELGDDPTSCSRLSTTSLSRRPRSRRCTTRLCTRRGGRGQDPAARHPPSGGRRPADPQAGRPAVELAKRAADYPRRTSLPTSPTTSPRSWTSGSRPSRWTPGSRTCTRPRWARTSGCRRCTGI